MNPTLLSYCTCLFNRGDQLQATWQNNVLRIQADPRLEWCIYDWGSSDGIFEWVMERLPKLTKRIRWCQSDRMNQPWHISLGKNGAHFMANGKILMNIDADNFIMPKSNDMICGYIPRKLDLVHLCNDLDNHQGTYGRIALKREIFYELGGYDEALPAAGCQDVDLVERTRAKGYRVARILREGGLAIQHGDESRLKYITQDPSIVMWDFYRTSREQSAKNIAEGRLIANGSEIVHEWDAHLKNNCRFYQGGVEC